MNTELDFYELLGVQPTATQSEIKSAFRHQVMRNHPDKGGNPVFFRMLEDAYEVLISPSRRQDYDARVRGETGHATPPGGNPANGPFWDEPTGAHQWGEGSHWDADQPDPYAAGVSYSRRSSMPHGRPGLLGSRAIRRSSVLIVALVWAVIALSKGWPIIPGLSYSQTLTLVTWMLVVWLFGSIVLRFIGWGLAIWALFDAYSNAASVPITLSRLTLAFVIWMAGQWFFTYRNGAWRSVLAHSIFSKFPSLLQPDRRFG